MEIELPDGTVLEAPDGADIQKVVKGYKLQQRIASNPEEYAPNSPKYSPVGDEPLVEGTGSGMIRATRGIASLLNKTINAHPLAKMVGGVNLPNKEFYSQEAADRQTEIDTPLMNTRKGALGRMLGETAITTAVTAPIGGIGAVKPGANVLARTLGSAPMRAAVEGGIGGAITSDPDEQGEGALKGAAISAILDRFLAGGGRAIRGLVKKSQAAQEIEQLAGQHGEDIFIPLSQAADETDAISRIGKQVYSEALPIIPGVKYRLNKQGREAGEKLREIAIKEATPDGVSLPANPGRNVEESVNVLQKGFDDTLDDTVKSYAFQVPSSFKNDVVRAMRASASPKTTVNSETLSVLSSKIDDLMQKFSNKSGVIDGENLLNLRGEISTLLKRAKGYETGPLNAAINHVDDMIKTQLKQGNVQQNLTDLQRYLDLEPAARAFKPLKEAAGASPETEGRFLFKTLARKATGSPEQRAIGQLGAQTLDKPAATGTLTGRILANVGVAGAGIGAFMEPTTTAAVMAGGQVLTSKVAQKALMGDLKAQRAIASYIQSHPDQIQNVERFLRQAAVSGQSGE